MSKELDKMIDDFFNWSKKEYRFKRPLFDTSPYSVIYKDDKIILVHNILGIDKKDLTLDEYVDNDTHYLLIKGKTVDEITGQEYSISSTFYLGDGLKIDNNGIKSLAKNGLLYITIPYKKKEQEKKKTITIE